jgi:sugar lactone lactonase YvrE
MVVGDEELYAANSSGSCVHVFSLEGEHRRDIYAGFEEPWYLAFFNGRLYLSEEDASSAEDQGRRIFVLTPHGAVLQVYTLPNAEFVIGFGICAGRMIVHAGPTQRQVNDSNHLFCLRGI